MNQNIIAIDGPAGSGKSTIAREVAKAKSMCYLDSGSYYRAITYYFLRKYKSLQMSQEFSSWISSLDLKEELKNLQLHTEFVNLQENKTFLNGEEISEQIRTPEVTDATKHLSRLKPVREFVNQNLYKLSKDYKLVIDGRDIGTEVFPDAKYKFFLTASPEVRAKRRWEEWKAKGIELDYPKILEETLQRDKSDMEREISPLKKASDAIEIDTSFLTKNQVLEKILLFLEKIG